MRSTSALTGNTSRTPLTLCPALHERGRRDDEHGRADDGQSQIENGGQGHERTRVVETSGHYDRLPKRR
jgi:hypothetical protein